MPSNTPLPNQSKMPYFRFKHMVKIVRIETNTIIFFCFLQLTVDSANGLHTPIVPTRAAMEHKNEQDHVLNPYHNTEESRARDLLF